MDTTLSELQNRKEELEIELRSVNSKIESIFEHERMARFDLNHLEPLDDLMVIEEFMKLPHIEDHNRDFPYSIYSIGQTLKIRGINSNHMCVVGGDWTGDGEYSSCIGSIPIVIVRKMRSAYLGGGDYEKWRKSIDE